MQTSVYQVLIVHQHPNESLALLEAGPSFSPLTLVVLALQQNPVPHFNL